MFPYCSVSLSICEGLSSIFKLLSIWLSRADDIVIVAGGLRSGAAGCFRRQSCSETGSYPQQCLFSQQQRYDRLLKTVENGGYTPWPFSILSARMIVLTQVQRELLSIWIVRVFGCREFKNWCLNGCKQTQLSKLKTINHCGTPSLNFQAKGMFMHCSWINSNKSIYTLWPFPTTEIKNATSLP